MPEALRRHLPDALALLTAAALLVLLGMLWGVRLRYPFDLEWMEGGMLIHALRLQQGQPLYPAPGADFIPYIYPPGYAASLAAASEVFGLSYQTGRALSLFGSISAALAIVFAGWQRNGRVLGLLGGCVFLGAYPMGGAFYDLVRLDGMMMGLLAWSIVLGMVDDRRATVLSGLLLAAAFLFKQHVALFGLPMVFAIYLRDGRAGALRFTVASAAPALATTVALQVHSGGTYLDYLLKVAASHPIVGQRVVPGTPNELGWGMGLVGLLGVGALVHEGAVDATDVERKRAYGLGALCSLLLVLVPLLPGHPPVPRWLVACGGGIVGLGVAAVVLQARRLYRAEDRRSRWLLAYGVGVGAMAVLTSALMRGHHGGYLNVHIQSFWVLALGGALAAIELRRRVARKRVAWATALVFLGQLAVQIDAVDVDKYAPTLVDETTGYRVLAQLAELEGPVLSPIAPFLPVQAGHAPHWHLIAYWDVVHPGSPWPDYDAQSRQRIQDQHWGSIIAGPRPLKMGLQGPYKQAHRFDYRGTEFRPSTGWPARPAQIWVPDPDYDPTAPTNKSRSKTKPPREK